MVVVLEHAGAGGHAAGPLARELVRKMFQVGCFASDGVPVADDRSQSATSRR
jgi:hypothetical protein